MKVIYSEGYEKILQNYTEIGKSFAYDGTNKKIWKLHHVMDKYFTKTYEYDIENKLMKDLNLAYSWKFNFNGCIIRMVSKRKGDMVSIFQR